MSISNPTPARSMKPLRPKAGRRAATLLVSMVAVFISVATVAIILQSSTRSASTTRQTRQISDTRRAAQSVLEYAGARMRVELDRPAAPLAPAQSDFTTIMSGIAGSMPDAAALGIDTAVYTAAISAPTVGTIATQIDTPLIDFKNPARRDYPCLGARPVVLVRAPISATLTLTHRQSGIQTSVTLAADLIHAKRTFLQYGYYYNGYNPQISSGMPGKIKGGIFSNNPIKIWTNDWGGLGNGAIIQIDAIAGKSVQLGSGSNNNFPGIYISGGDLGIATSSPTARTNGKVTFFANHNSPFSLPTNPYDAAVAKSDFIPAFVTVADTGNTTDPANYFKNVNATNYSQYSSGKRYIIDSLNPDIAQLSARFNGNFKDATTGWSERYPDTLPKSMQQLPVSDLTAAGLVPTDPRAMIEPPQAIDPSPGGIATRGPEAQQQEVENSKLANQSKFYILVENPADAATQPLPPVIFTSAKAAAKYKKASEGLSDIKKLELRSDAFAGDILVLPKSAATAIEVKRSFYDESQRRASSSDPVKSIRVSAVDINMGVLREAIGTSTTSTTLKYANGSAWTPTDSATGWNGVVYVDVLNPKGNAWVARTNASTPVELKYDDSTPITNPTIPEDYKYSGGPLIDVASSAKVADPLNTAAEEPLIAVRVYNANKVPDLTGYPGYTGQSGITLATNTAVYTVGHINADGQRSTDKGNNAVDTQFADPTATGKEPASVPFAIACDSLTAFSPSFYRNTMDSSSTYDPTSTKLDGGDWCLASRSTRISQTSGFTDKFHEMNFSLISGGTDTSLRGSYGTSALQPAFVVNIPVGEYRVGLDTRYRGSRNMLFKSKYNRKYYNNVSSSYERSNDDAYDLTMKDSVANIPPGMPLIREYALINMRTTATTSR